MKQKKYLPIIDEDTFVSILTDDLITLKKKYKLPMLRFLVAIELEDEFTDRRMFTLMHDAVELEEYEMAVIFRDELMRRQFCMN